MSTTDPAKIRMLKLQQRLQMLKPNDPQEPRLRRQLAMLMEVDRKAQPMPEQLRRFA